MRNIKLVINEGVIWQAPEEYVDMVVSKIGIKIMMGFRVETEQ